MGASSSRALPKEKGPRTSGAGRVFSFSVSSSENLFVVEKIMW